MIESFLVDALGRDVDGLRILDVGCGNGDMAAYFAARNYAVGADIADQARDEHAVLPRCVARSERLPFLSGAFDVVVSHHVLEHVQSHDLHMSEIKRVLHPDGLCYLGTPNLSSPFMRGHVGNNMVLGYGDMLSLFKRHGFSVQEYYTQWLSQPDRYFCETRLLRFVPGPILHLLRWWYPSQCFLLRPIR